MNWEDYRTEKSIGVRRTCADPAYEICVFKGIDDEHFKCQLSEIDVKDGSYHRESEICTSPENAYHSLCVASPTPLLEYWDPFFGNSNEEDCSEMLEAWGKIAS